MLTPCVSPTDNTPDLMAEAGLIYNADWGHDDEPFPMKVKTGRLISMPYNLDLNEEHSIVLVATGVLGPIHKRPV
ncbi:MAG: hypothetical protein CM1200mP6_07580 [Anaerolineaceae bacterium]|nr:MAG: hypothetical protein CM1200mP6_07580 [Anaerolineaceae bacterium]